MLISQESADLITREINIIMHRPIFLADENARIIASTEFKRVGQEHAGARELVSKGLKYFVSPKPCSERERDICFPVYLSDRIVGVVGIVSETAGVEDIIVYYSDTIQRIAEVRIQRLSRRMSHEEEQRYFDHARQIFFESTLFSGTLTDYLNDDEAVFRASLLGIDLVQPRIIVVLSFETDFSRSAEGAVPQALSTKNINDFARYLKQHVRDHQQNFCFASEQQVVILFCSNSVDAVLEQAARLCGDLENFYSIRIYGGISSVAEGPIHFKRCYGEAKTACLMAQKIQRKMLLVYNVTSPYFIAQSLAPEVREALVSSVFQGVPAEEMREMARIIQTYCDNGGIVEQAAAAIFMHRNTFLYRSNKIRAATGYNMKDPKDLFVLYLAVLSL